MKNSRAGFCSPDKSHFLPPVYKSFVLARVRPYHLHLKESFSSVSQYSGEDFAEFMSLAHIPVREGEGFNNLGQLVDNADDVQGQHVHFMAAVKHVSVPQYGSLRIR